MIVLQETTAWPEGDQCPNNIYIFKVKPDRTGQCVAYIKRGETKVIKFSKPMALDMRHRTFEAVK